MFASCLASGEFEKSSGRQRNQSSAAAWNGQATKGSPSSFSLINFFKGKDESKAEATESDTNDASEQSNQVIDKIASNPDLFEASFPCAGECRSLKSAYSSKQWLPGPQSLKLESHVANFSPQGPPPLIQEAHDPKLLCGQNRSTHHKAPGPIVNDTWIPNITSRASMQQRSRMHMNARHAPTTDAFKNCGARVVVQNPPQKQSLSPQVVGSSNFEGGEDISTAGYFGNSPFFNSPPLELKRKMCANPAKKVFPVVGSPQGTFDLLNLPNCAVLTESCNSVKLSTTTIPHPNQKQLNYYAEKIKQQLEGTNSSTMEGTSASSQQGFKVEPFSYNYSGKQMEQDSNDDSDVFMGAALIDSTGFAGFPKKLSSPLPARTSYRSLDTSVGNGTMDASRTKNDPMTPQSAMNYPQYSPLGNYKTDTQLWNPYKDDHPVTYTKGPTYNSHERFENVYPDSGAGGNVCYHQGAGGTVSPPSETANICGFNEVSDRRFASPYQLSQSEKLKLRNAGGRGIIQESTFGRIERPRDPHFSNLEEQSAQFHYLVQRNEDKIRALQAEIEMLMEKQGERSGYASHAPHDRSPHDLRNRKSSYRRYSNGRDSSGTSERIRARMERKTSPEGLYSPRASPYGGNSKNAATLCKISDPVQRSRKGRVARQSVDNCCELRSPSERSDGGPAYPYIAQRSEMIDKSLEEWHNSSESSVEWTRCSYGIYKFGSIEVQLSVHNGKIRVKTLRVPWNNFKSAPIDKFVSHFEQLEVAHQ